MDSPLLSFGAIEASNGFRMKDYWIWCPSVIRGDDGLYHLFSSRWPKWLPFHPGWMTHSEVVRAVARTPEGPYEFKEVVLPARGPEYWDGRSTHNPTIRRYAGRYYLFYTGSTHALPDLHPGDRFPLSDPRCLVARSMKRVGLAWADSLAGPWHRADAPILPTKPGTFYSFLTSNPAPCIHEDGRVTLLFKARAWQGEKFGPMTIGLATALSPGDSYSVASQEPVFSSSRFGEMEDPFLWHDGEGYKMIAKDMTGRLCGQAGGGVYATSRDALHWEIGNPPTAYLREISMADGSTATMGNIERPFLLRNGETITHLCAAVSNGREGFGDATETWNVVLPVKINR